jgi:hypothetical protein
MKNKVKDMQNKFEKKNLNLCILVFVTMARVCANFHAKIDTYVSPITKKKTNCLALNKQQIWYLPCHFSTGRNVSVFLLMIICEQPTDTKYKHL